MRWVSNRFRANQGWAGYVAALVLSLSAQSALGMHENDHRFTVFGYLRDAQGTPLSGRPVTVSHIGGEKKETMTASNGYYEVVLHLHSENRGDEIDVVAADETKRTSADFNPDDRVTPRNAEVDFGAPGKGSPGRTLVMGAAVLGAGTLAYAGWGYLRKKTRGRAKGSAKRSPKKKRH